MSNSNGVVVSADEYFITRSGEYKFNPNELPNAHVYARKQALEAMIQNIPLVIVDNTNLQVKKLNWLLLKSNNMSVSKFCYTFNHLSVST
jgi:hypothetical protein